MVIIFSLLTVLATFLGGIFALKQKDKLHLILGFSAGAVLGVAFFDLLPEAIDLGTKSFSINTITALIAGGFGIFLLIDRFIRLHHHTEEDHDHPEFNVGGIGALTLSVHSFLDGAGIGLAFKVSPALGLIVTAGVIAHDFSDGINTVSMILKNHGSGKQAFRWLIIDAIAPAFGAASTLLFTLPEDKLGLVLALFAGFFLYLGASDILPESHHNHPTFWTTVSTILGALVILGAIRLASL